MLYINVMITKKLKGDFLQISAKRNGKPEQIAKINIGYKYTEEDKNNLIKAIVKCWGIDSYVVI